MGIPLFDDFSKLQVITAQLQKFKTGMFFLNELNIDTTKTRIHQRIKDLVTRCDKHCKYQHSTMESETFLSDKNQEEQW